MFTKSLQIGFVGMLLCIASAWAGPSSIQGIVKDAKGQAIKGADVRIESKDGKQLFGAVKSDAQGRYISQGLQPGVYRVSLVVNGAVKASITNTKTRSDDGFVQRRAVSSRRKLVLRAASPLNRRSVGRSYADRATVCAAVRASN